MTTDPNASADPSQRVGFFGPFGTFTEQALRTQPDLAARELVAYRSVPDILDAVTAGQIGVGFVPIENSIEGMVNFTLDALAFDHDLIITRDVVLDIEHCLVGRSGTALADVKEVLSIPVATAQCHRFLREQVPGAVVRASDSTASSTSGMVGNSTSSAAARSGWLHSACSVNVPRGPRNPTRSARGVEVTSSG